MKTRKFQFELESRTNDIDGNKIDVEQDVVEIHDAIAEFWNVVSISEKESKI